MDFNIQGYDLQFIQVQKVKDDSDHLFSFIYKFYSPKTKYRYILTADYNREDFFAIKFYPKPFRKSDRKYSIITNKGDLGNILVSCLKVIPILLIEYPRASFGFAGARTYDPVYKRRSRRRNKSSKSDKKRKRILEGRWEQIESNQRFNIYSYVAKKKIGNKTFQHFEYKEISSYMLVNRSSGNIDEREFILKEMLSNTYNNLPAP